MFEVILTSVIVALLVQIAYITKAHKDEINGLVKALIAKNLTEITTSEIMKEEKPAPVKQEAIPLEEADESLFKKYLKLKENGGQDELPEV